MLMHFGVLLCAPLFGVASHAPQSATPQQHTHNLLVSNLRSYMQRSQACIVNVIYLWVAVQHL
jgi:hypothetical protein